MKSSNATVLRLLHTRIYQLIAIFLFWLLVAMINASNLFIEFGDRYDGGWMNMFVRQLPVWIPWAIVSILIVNILDRTHGVGSKALISIHFALLAGVLFSYTFLQAILGVFLYDTGLTLLAYWAQIFSNSLVVNLLIYVLILLLAYFMIWYKSYKESEVIAAHLSTKTSVLEKQLAEARINALTMQLNPHFLFNSLHSVASLIRSEKKSDAIDMISGLSDLLRKTTDFDHANLVSLKEEIDFVRQYLSIEQIRFSNRLIIEYKIPKEVLNFMVPRFILQPVIENALKHGLKDKEKNALVEVAASKVEESVKLVVSDNGKGLDDNWQNHPGLGIDNIRKRLEGIYGKEYEFSMRTNDVDNSGTVVEIKLPIQWMRDSKY